MHYLVDLTIRVVVIYAGIAAGFFLQKWSHAEKAGKWLLFVGLNILTPILLIFVSLNIESFSNVNWWYIVLITTVSMLVSMIIDWIMIRKKEIPNDQKGAELCATGFMNGLFYPFPILIGILPKELQAEGLLAASLFLVVQMIYRNSFGLYLGIRFGTNSHKSILKIIKDLILFPPTIGMIIGLILRFSIGQFDTSDKLAMDIFRDGTMVIMLILVGLGFKLPKKEEWKQIALFRGIFSRFGGGLLTTLMIVFLPIPLITKIPTIIQSMSPPAVANSAYAKYFGLDEVLTSRYIALLTIIALLFLPAEIALLVWWQQSIL